MSEPDEEPDAEPDPESEPEPDPEPGHVEAVALQLAELHADYHQQTTGAQRRIANVTNWIAKPLVILGLGVVVAAWIAINGFGSRLGLRAVDPSPFALLELVATLLALFTTVLILAAQRREEELERRRSQLTLQLAAQNEQMISKVIQLLEEQRRENPLLPNRRDQEAEKMAKPSDPKAVLGQVIDSHRQAEERRG